MSEFRTETDRLGAMHAATVAGTIRRLVPAVMALRAAALAPGLVCAEDFDRIVDPAKMVAPCGATDA